MGWGSPKCRHKGQENGGPQAQRWQSVAGRASLTWDRPPPVPSLTPKWSRPLSPSSSVCAQHSTGSHGERTQMVARLRRRGLVGACALWYGQSMPMSVSVSIGTMGFGGGLRSRCCALQMELQSTTCGLHCSGQATRLPNQHLALFLSISRLHVQTTGGTCAKLREHGRDGPASGGMQNDTTHKDQRAHFSCRIPESERHKPRSQTIPPTCTWGHYRGPRVDWVGPTVLLGR